MDEADTPLVADAVREIIELANQPGRTLI